MDRRSFLGASGMALASMGLPGANAPALAEEGDEAVLATVNPELRPFARHILPMFRQRGPLNAKTLAGERKMSELYGRRPLADVPVELREIAGAAGQPSVKVLLVNAGKPGARPAIVHTHGGGFVSGSAKASVAELQDVCRQLDCVGITVEYRLAPETGWRGSLEDNYAALKWLHGNAAELGLDPRRIAVMGESAGGGHAALLAIAARDRGEIPVAFQCLTYPMLDDRTGSSRKMPPQLGKIIWTAENNRFGWSSFLGVPPGGANVPRGAVPARVRSVEGLPPAFIGVGSIDLFVDEDVAYAQRLIDAGIATELIVVPGAFHGFDALPIPSTIGTQFTAARLAALRKGLALA